MDLKGHSEKECGHGELQHALGTRERVIFSEIPQTCPQCPLQTELDYKLLLQLTSFLKGHILLKAEDPGKSSSVTEL